MTEFPRNAPMQSQTAAIGLALGLTVPSVIPVRRSNRMTTRRVFITLLGGAAAWPLAANAQQPDRMRRIGVLIGGDENDPVLKTRVSAFAQALAGLGWTDGRNV